MKITKEHVGTCIAYCESPDAPVPAFDTRVLPLELVAAGYEMDGAESDFKRVWSTRGQTYTSTEWLREYHTAAEEVFERANRSMADAWYSSRMVEPDDAVAEALIVWPGLTEGQILSATIMRIDEEETGGEKKDG